MLALGGCRGWVQVGCGLLTNNHLNPSQEAPAELLAALPGYLRLLYLMMLVQCWPADESGYAASLYTRGLSSAVHWHTFHKSKSGGCCTARLLVCLLQ